MDWNEVLKRLHILALYVEHREAHDLPISAFVVLRKLQEISSDIRKCTNTVTRDQSDGTAATATHYQIDGARLQPVEMLQDILTPEEFRGWLKGNMFKYFCRAGKKPGEPYEKDMAKCLQFNEWLKQAAAGKKINPRE